MTEAQSLASTANVLHPRQVVELNETKQKLENILVGPSYVQGQLQDKSHAGKQLQHTDRMLEQAPAPILPGEIDAAVTLETELRESWLTGMPTHAEMRRNVAGAVDKHMAWERRTKKDVLRWKHLRRRLHASGISEHRQADEGDISNVEMFRPTGGAQELNMDNAQIPGKIIKLPPAGAALGSVMTAEDAEVLAEINPELLDRMAVLDNEQRAEVLDLVRKMSALSADEAGEAQVSAEPVRPKRRATPKKRKARGSYKESELAALRTECKALGINSYGMSKIVMREEIGARKVA